MKFRKLMIILIVFGCLLVLVFLKKATLNRNKSIIENVGLSSDVIELTKEFSDSFIGKIIIFKGDAPDKKIIFAKSDGGAWEMPERFGLRARPEAVAALIKEISGLKGETRADSEEVLKDFLIDDGQGVHIQLESQSGGVLTYLIVGFVKPSWNINFVRLHGSNQVVLVKKDILGRVNLYSKDAVLDSNYFADYKVASFDTAQVERLELGGVSLKKPLRMSKPQRKEGEPASWDLKDIRKGYRVDSAKIDGYLQFVAGVYARDIIDPKAEESSFERPVLEVKVFGGQTSNPLVWLVVGPLIPDQKAYYLKDALHSKVYLVPDNFVQNMLQDEKYFVSPEVKR